MPSIAEHLAIARRHHESGAIAQAEQIYRQVLAVDPRNAEALDLAGVAAHQSGRPAEAIELLSRAIAVNPSVSIYHNHLGAACGAAGQLERAEQSFREAVRLTPHDPQVHYNLAALLNMRNKYQEAVGEYRHALRLQSHFPEALFNLGNTLSELGQVNEAIESYRKALQLRPNYVLALNNLGNLLNVQGRFEEAVSTFETALRHKPDHLKARNNLGVALVELGKFAEAAPHYAEVLRRDPNFAEALNNQGVWHYKQNQLEPAIDHFGRAIALNPNYNEAHKNRAAAWLLQGDFARGWSEYEWRWKCKDCPPHGYPQPLWDGSSLAGRTILLHAEQGLGDTLQFIRYAPLVKAQGGTVVARIPAALMRILRNLPGVDQWCNDDGQLPRIDVQAPLLSLPRILGTTPTTIPADIPYLHAEPGLIDFWRQEFGKFAGRKIGINWQGRPRSEHYRGDVQRAIPLAEFEPLARVPGVALISLQKGPGVEQIAEVAPRFKVHELGDEVDTVAGAFMDTAAIMKNLDLVITSDTATVHLAGALGVPTWLALPSAPDWRWLLGQNTTRWYPTVRLFRQQEWGVWQPVFQEMARELDTTSN